MSTGPQQHLKCSFVYKATSVKLSKEFAIRRLSRTCHALIGGKRACETNPGGLFEKAAKPLHAVARSRSLGEIPLQLPADLTQRISMHDML